MGAESGGLNRELFLKRIHSADHKGTVHSQAEFGILDAGKMTGEVVTCSCRPYFLYPGLIDSVAEEVKCKGLFPPASRCDLLQIDFCNTAAHGFTRLRYANSWRKGYFWLREYANPVIVAPGRMFVVPRHMLVAPGRIFVALRTRRNKDSCAQQQRSHAKRRSLP